MINNWNIGKLSSTSWVSIGDKVTFDWQISCVRSWTPCDLNYRLHDNELEDFSGAQWNQNNEKKLVCNRKISFIPKSIGSHQLCNKSVYSASARKWLTCCQPFPKFYNIQWCIFVQSTNLRWEIIYLKLRFVSYARVVMWFLCVSLIPSTSPNKSMYYECSWCKVKVNVSEKGKISSWRRRKTI